MTTALISKPLTQPSLRRQKQGCLPWTRHAIRHPDAAQCHSLTQGINVPCLSTSPTRCYHLLRQPQRPHRISSWNWRQRRGSFHHNPCLPVRHCSLCHPFWPVSPQSAWRSPSAHAGHGDAMGGLADGIGTRMPHRYPARRHGLLV